MTKTGLSGWRAAHSITFCQAGQRQNRAEGRRICVRDAGGCLAGSIIKPMVESMVLSWQQGPLSTGAISRFLVPEPLPKRLLYVERLRRRMRVRFGRIWIADSENVLLFSGQTVVPHGPDRNLDVCVVHEPGGVPAAAASG